MSNIPVEFHEGLEEALSKAKAIKEERKKKKEKILESIVLGICPYCLERKIRFRFRMFSTSVKYFCTSESCSDERGKPRLLFKDSPEGE